MASRTIVGPNLGLLPVTRTEHRGALYIMTTPREAVSKNQRCSLGSHCATHGCRLRPAAGGLHCERVYPSEEPYPPILRHLKSVDLEQHHAESTASAECALV